MWPGGNGTIPSDMQGTLILADPTDDHALMHRKSGTLLNALPTVFGTTSGTNLLRGVANASDQLFSLNSGGTANTTITKGTANNMTLGTPTITGGQMAGSANIAAGTIAAVVGTATTNNLGANWLNVSNGTAVNVGSAAAPTVNQVLTATTGSAATWQAAQSLTFVTTGMQALGTTASGSPVSLPGGTITFAPTKNISYQIIAKGYAKNNAVTNPEFFLLVNGGTIDYTAITTTNTASWIPWTLAGQGTMGSGNGTVIVQFDSGGGGTTTSGSLNINLIWG